MDLSTINMPLLKSWGRYYGPTPDDHLGSGCAGDAPGYPSYFLQTADGMCQVIKADDSNFYVVLSPDMDEENRKENLRNLWLPLHYNHPRTRMWVFDTYKNHHNCYNGFGDGMIIYPVPNWQLVTKGAFDRYKDDATKSEAVKTVERLRVRQKKVSIEKECASIATPENHNAVRVIRKFYPKHQPDIGLINKSFSDKLVPVLPELWWETEAERPSEENCAKSQRWHNQHPFGSTHCQWCGRSYPKEEKVESELTLKFSNLKRLDGGVG